jgi:hypothetical protein
MQGDLCMGQGRLEGAPAELLEDFLDGFHRDSIGILEWIFEIGDALNVYTMEYVGE